MEARARLDLLRSRQMRLKWPCHSPSTEIYLVCRMLRGRVRSKPD